MVSPDTRYAFRDGGLPADGFYEQLVRQAPDHLAEGGFAHLLISWLLQGEDRERRPRSWLEEAAAMPGCCKECHATW